MLPIYTRKLSPEDYGVLALIGLVLEIASYMGLVRIGTGVLRLYHECGDRQAQRELVATAAWMVNLSHLFGALLLLATAPWLAEVFLRGPEDAGILALAALQFLVQGLGVITGTTDRIRGRARRFVTRNLVQLVLQAVLNIALVVWLDLGIHGFLISGIVGPAVVGLVAFWQLVREDGLRGRRDFARELARFAAPLIAASAAVMITTLATQLSLKHLASIAELGLYSLAVTFGMLVVRLGNAPYMLGWEAERFEYADHPDRDLLYSRSLRRLTVALLAVGTGVAVLVHDYLRIGATPAYAPVAWLAPIAVGAFVLQSWAVFLDTGALLSKRTEAVARANWIAAAATVAALLLLVPRLGGTGAVLALVVNNAVRLALVYSASQRLTPIVYDWAPVLRLVALSAAVAMAAAATASLPIPLALAAHALLLVAYFGMHVPLRVLPPEDGTWVLALVARLPGGRRLAAWHGGIV
jgi:O-antigen/teichoic acid export membrane protein